MKEVPIRDVVVEEWRDVLGVDDPGPADDFFSVGGDSMLALEFVDRLEQRLNISFPLDILFVHGTLGAVVEACEERVGGVVAL